MPQAFPEVHAIKIQQYEYRDKARLHEGKGARLEFPENGCAGFPFPAKDYEAKRLDINEYLIQNPVSTFFFPVRGDSMQGAEIFDGDIQVVDRSVSACHRHIVIAFVNGERLVKRLYRRGGRVALVAENPAYPCLEFAEGNVLEIWGVVVGKFKRLPS